MNWTITREVALAVLIGVAAAGGAAQPTHADAALSQRSVELLSPQRLLTMIQAEERLVFIDVREPEEFAESHIPGAINIPQRDFARRIGEVDKNALVVPYCNMDFRGFLAVQELRALGLSSVALMQERGIEGWRAHGLTTAGPESGFTDEQALAKLHETSAAELLGDRHVTPVAPTGVVRRFDLEAGEWFFDPNDLEVSAGDEVRIRIHTTDGNHYFVQPDYELALIRH